MSVDPVPVQNNRFLKSLGMIIPPLVLGNVLDQYVLSLKTREKLGGSLLTYIAFQTFLNAVLIQAMSHVFKSFATDAHVLMPGLYFSFFFGMQTCFVANWKEFMNGGKFV